MAKTKELEGGVEVQDQPVDLSPEAQEVRKNLAMAGAKIFDKGRIQKIVEDYRERNPYVENILDNQGNPVPMPEIVVTDGFIADLEKQIVPIIQDCCRDTQTVIRKKIKAQRHLHTDGRAGVERLDTALSSLRGNLVVPPTPSR